MSTSVANDMFEYTDDLGPGKIIHMFDPLNGLKAILVVDNVAAGPAIGGVRMATNVTTDECVRLARAMTLKNAMAGLAHGGGKAVIKADPNMPAEAKGNLIRAFAQAINQIEDYIPGPDMGTNEASMAITRNITGRAVGLPREVGGIPLDEIGATGYGLTIALEAAEAFTDFRLDGARIVIEGFGSVGQHAARYLSERGALLVGVADSGGVRLCPNGFDLPKLLAFKRSGNSVVDFDGGERATTQALIAAECDVWIPAARPDVIHEGNVDDFNTKVIAQGANIPATEVAERRLAERGILVLPDFVANAGGVICAAVEYHQGSEAQAMASIAEKIRANVIETLTRSSQAAQLPREAALEIAAERVRRAMGYLVRF